jgi:hypothetical protein
MNVGFPTKKTMLLVHYDLYLNDFFSDYAQKESPYLNGRFRKWRFNGYVNRQKSETRFMNRFKYKFGGPDTTAVYLGDWGASPADILRGHVCIFVLI